ncbi:MAG: hypothetical protein UT05_C0001G0091 [Parcubacteria group bacterium GW2011_GWF2_38_76]|nr:MAG: hypothetical protein UT05_C0001G0091 [Parcubacteria group bacterium GW2011_GWF2_38_76]HBM45933.1 hypothetical protein [Patescibacteria group bacterium]
MLKIPREDREILRNLLRDYDNGIGNKVEPKEAMQRIRRGLIEICQTNYFCGLELKFSRSHSSNGLLLTQNGYFVTCFHCIENGIKNLIIVDDDGNSYPIEGVCACSKDKDIAIAKAKINNVRKHIVYRYDKFQTKNQLYLSLSRWNEKVLAKGTHFVGTVKINSTGVTYLGSKNHSKPGDSGSIIANINGGIASLLHGTGYDDPLDTNKTTVSISFMLIIDLMRQICK